MTTPQRIAPEPVETITITTLVDNYTDSILPDQGPARRSRSQARLETPLMEEGRAPDPFRAEHGFSALISLTSAGRTRRVLFDTGITPDGMVENMRRLEETPKDVEAVVLSHGHFDHTGGLAGMARFLGRSGMPAILHPEFWNRRRLIVPDRDPLNLPTVSKTGLRGLGFEVIEERQPSFLLDRALLITGEVDRTTDFEHGLPGQEKHVHGEWTPDPLTLDDQAVVLHLRGHGLVVMTGCGHAGIVNIVRHAQNLTGVQRVYAVIGGFHLGGPGFEAAIPPVVQALTEVSPAVIVPAHCTGWRAAQALAAAFPDAFVQNTVGTRMLFGTNGS